MAGRETGAAGREQMQLCALSESLGTSKAMEHVAQGATESLLKAEAVITSSVHVENISHGSSSQDLASELLDYLLLCSTARREMQNLTE